MNVNDIERLMLLMKEHRVDLVQVGDVKLVKAQHDPVARAVRERSTSTPKDDDGVEADLFGPNH